MIQTDPGSSDSVWGHLDLLDFLIWILKETHVSEIQTVGRVFVVQDSHEGQMIRVLLVLLAVT